MTCSQVAEPHAAYGIWNQRNIRWFIWELSPNNMTMQDWCCRHAALRNEHEARGTLIQFTMSMSSHPNSINNYSLYFPTNIETDTHVGSLYLVNHSYHMSYHITSHHHCFCTFSALDSNAVLRLLWIRETELLVCVSANSSMGRCVFSPFGERSNTGKTGWPIY